MLNPSSNTKAFICSEPIDMRSSFDSLSGIVQLHFGQSPLSGNLFVFFSRRRDRMKVLFWELDGFVLYYKRLEHGTFAWVQQLDLKHSCEMPYSDFALLLAGINMHSDKSRSTQSRKKAPLHLV